MKEPLWSQTQFSLEEPLFEGMTAVPPEPVVEEVKKPKIPWYKQRKLVIAAIAGATLLVIIILFIINMVIESGRRPVVADPVPLATALPATASAALEKIAVTEAELKDADPNQQQLVFPAVDMSLRLDPPARP